MNLVSRLLTVVPVAVLAGCVAPQPLVKDVLIDPHSYLASNLSEAKLPDPVRDALGVQAPGSVKRQVRIDAVMTNVDGDKKQNFEKTYTFHVLDNGLARVLIQTGNNGMHSLTEFGLSYHGVFYLIYTSMSHSATNVFSPTYTKAIARLDKGIGEPQEATEYVFEYALAPEVQIANFQNRKTTCKTGKWVSAGTVHAKLKGVALPVDCEYFGRNGENFLKSQSVFIKDLGVTLPRESATSTRKRFWTVSDVK
jgi:hypothetical protein